MSQLYYQPVALPNFGSAASGVTQAGLGLSTSLRSLGEGITNLGKRRQARLDEENARAQQGALEALKLVAGGAGSDAELASINNALLGLPEGVTLPGAADAVAQRRSALLENDLTRADIASRTATARNTNATARGTELENTGLEATNRLNARNQAFQDEFASDINEVRRLNTVGDRAAANELEQSILARAGDRFGTDPSALLSGSLSLFGEGETVRDDNASRDLDRRGERQRQDIQAAEASDQNRERDSLFQVNSLKREVEADNIVRGEVTDQIVAQSMTNAISEEDALLNLRNTPNLTARERTAAAEGIRAKFSADPNALDTYNPLDPSIPTDRIFNNTDRAEASLNDTLKNLGYKGPEIQLNSNSDIDVPRTAAGIAAAGQRVIRANPSFAIFNEIQAIEQSDLTNAAGAIPNMGQAIRDQYPQLSTPDKWINEVNRLQRKHKLSDAETMAIVDRSMKARGANFLGINMLPGNQRADETIIDVDEFDKLAADFTKNNAGSLGADFKTVNDMVGRAGTLSNQITDLETQRQRAQQAGRTATVNRLNDRITDARDELAGIETRIQGLLPESSNAGATTEDVVSGIASLTSEKARQTFRLGGR